MTKRKPQGQWAGRSYDPARSITIDLGTGSTANDRWIRLDNMVRELVRQFRQDLLYEYATVLVDWRKTLRYRIQEANHWTLELEPDEWQALSSGLRGMTGAPEYSSMYQWLNIHKVQADET